MADSGSSAGRRGGRGGRGGRVNRQSPTSGKQQFSFVTGTKLSDFKDPTTMRQVRSRVMHSYLDKAMRDPESTDVRVTKKRSNPRKEAASSAASSVSPSSTSSALDTPSETSVHPRIGRADSQSIDGWEDEPMSAAKDEMLAKMKRDPQLDVLPWPCVLDILRSMPSGPADALSMASIAEVNAASQLPNGARRTKSEPGTQSDLDAFMDSTKMRRFWFEIHNALGDGGLNIAMLKSACMRFFGSAGMIAEWLPYMISPASFLASLAVSAPYSDLMAHAQPQDKHFSKANYVQTLEIVNVLPKILGKALSHPDHGCSDYNIAAVLQFLCGQMTSAYNESVPAHQTFLKNLVLMRGGLQALSYGGVLPIVISITNMEASFLRNDRADDMYLAYAASHLQRQGIYDFLWTPQDLLVRPGSDLDPNATRPSYTSSVQKLLDNIANLTGAFLQQLSIETSLKDGLDIPLSGLNSIQQQVHHFAAEIHSMPDSKFPGHDGHNDHIYEAVRLTSILYAHAIIARVPLHRADSTTCAFGCKKTAASSTYLIQQSMAKTDMYRAWGSMTGVLHWVAMVAAAACHEQSPDGHNDGIDRPDLARSFTAPEAAGPGMRPDMHRSASMPGNNMDFPKLRIGCELGVSSDALIKLLDQVDQRMSSCYPAMGDPNAQDSSGSSTDVNMQQSPSWASSPAAPADATFSTTQTYTPRSLYRDGATLTRCYLTANAVRPSILLRFEHKNTVLKTMLTLCRVRDGLAASS